MSEMDIILMSTAVLNVVWCVLSANVPSQNFLPPNEGSSGPQTYGASSNEITKKENSRKGTGKDATILRFDQNIGEDGFHYAYETSNNIQAEVSGNTFQTRGAYAYKDDDGNIYSVTFTAGEDGFRPHGAHLPLPPLTPDDILVALKKNEQDEAAGIFDDGLRVPAPDS